MTVQPAPAGVQAICVGKQGLPWCRLRSQLLAQRPAFQQQALLFQSQCELAFNGHVVIPASQGLFAIARYPAATPAGWI